MPDLGFAAVAKDAFGWIASQAAAVDGGLAWYEDDVLYDHLYAGTAGVLLACAEARSVGVSPDGVSELARAARDRLVHLAASEQPMAGPDADNALFTGWAGAAVALRSWARAAGDDDALHAADRILAQLSKQVLDGVDNPSDYTDVISGDAGILLALVEGDSALSREAATVVVERLLALIEDGPAGPQWRMVTGWGYLMPGFSHGTAGVAYALALAGRALDRDDLVALATRAADGLIDLGGEVGSWALPVTIPELPQRPVVNFGWCHGPTGTARLFLLLDELAPHARWQSAVDACDQALRDSRIPDRRYPGYWDNVARCCGTAGVGQYLLDRYAQTGDRAYVEWSKRLGDDVVARRSLEAAGVAWSNTEHAADPPALPPQPGFMQGAAGIASWLVRLDVAVAGKPVAARAPDWV